MRVDRYIQGVPCWVELASHDALAGQQFYAQRFDWKTQYMPEFEHTEWLVGDNPIGGLLQMSQEWGEAAPHSMLYFAVDNCDARGAKAKESGGEICVPPTYIAKVGRFAVINDPQGGASP